MIDPPFERDDDYERMIAAMTTASKRWLGGSIALWYPLKHQDQVRRFHSDLASSGVRDLLLLELEIDRPNALPSLHGCGMIVRHPPFTLADEMMAVLPELTRMLERRPGSGNWRIEQLVQE